MQYSQCLTYHYNRYNGDSFRQADQINYNQWISETKKEVHTKSIVFYLGLILLPLDLLINLGFKMLSQDKLKQIQITHYYVQSFLLVYFTWSVLASVRFKQYFIKTILILLFQLIVIFITNFGLLLNNMYFKQQISLKNHLTLNEGVFYITLYIFISTLQTQVQNTQMKNRLQPSEEYYGVAQIPMDIIMPARNLLRTFNY